MLPSIYLTYNMLRSSKFTANADRFITAECNWPGTQVLSRKAVLEHGERDLTITLIGRPMPIDSLKIALGSRLKFYGLAGTRLNFIQGGDYAPEKENYSASAGDIYTLAQSTITRQQETIDSLRTVINAGESSVEAAPEVAPEIKVLFPNITRMGISTTVFTSPRDTTAADTATVAMIKVRHRLTKEEKNKLGEYLEARLGHKRVTVVEM